MFDKTKKAAFIESGLFLFVRLVFAYIKIVLTLLGVTPILTHMMTGTKKRTTKNGNKVHKAYTGKRSGHWISKHARLAIYIRDGFQCAYCGTNLKNARPFDITLDHLLPRVTGGSDKPTNLITACRSCNSARQDKPWMDYATGGAIDRIEQLRNSPVNLELAKALIAGTAGDAAIEALR